MENQMQEKRLRWAFLCGLALVALELAAFYQFNYGSWTWDWAVHASPAGALFFMAGALLLAAFHGLTRRIGSPGGDRDLRTYWIYCGVLMALCLIWSDLDTAQAIFAFIALLSTPLGIAGAALGTLPGGTAYRLCCGALLALSVAEALYHHWLMCRHRAQRFAALEG